jgi:hypothetical protein
MKVQHTFNGTGATLYLCLGFIPDWVRIISAEDGDVAEIEWFRDGAAAEIARGLYTVTGTTYRQIDARTVGDTGIYVYDGGDLLTTSNQTSVTYAEGVYLAPDKRNFQLISTDSLNPGDGSGGNITKWTLGSSANKTGNFDADVVGTYVGEGSRITIRGDRYAAFPEYEAMITALTAGQGIAANEVTLDRAIPSGEVTRLTGMYTMAPLARGLTTLPGIVLEMTTGINVNDEKHIIVAEKFSA